MKKLIIILLAFGMTTVFAQTKTYNEIETYLDANVNTNAAQKITGAILNTALVDYLLANQPSLSYDTTRNYVSGQFAIYNNSGYVCSSSTSGAFDAGDWVNISTSDTNLVRTTGSGQKVYQSLELLNTSIIKETGAAIYNSGKGFGIGKANIYNGGIGVVLDSGDIYNGSVGIAFKDGDLSNHGFGIAFRSSAINTGSYGIAINNAEVGASSIGIAVGNSDIKGGALNGLIIGDGNLISALATTAKNNAILSSTNSSIKGGDLCVILASDSSSIRTSSTNVTNSIIINGQGDTITESNTTAIGGTIKILDPVLSTSDSILTIDGSGKVGYKVNSYGFFFVQDSAVTLSPIAQDTFYHVTNATNDLFTQGDTLYTYISNDTVFFTVAGTYKVEFDLTIQGTSSKDYSFRIKNTIVCNGKKTVTGNGVNNFLSVSGKTVCTMSAGEFIVLQYANKSGTEDVVIRDASIYVKKDN